MNQRLRECTSVQESQLGFMPKWPGRSTTGAAIFGLKQTLEKHREDQKYINLVLVNPNRAHDRIPRKEVWRCAREQQVLEKYIIVLEEITKWVDDGSPVDVIYLDFQKAFDKAPHQRIIQKLKK